MRRSDEPMDACRETRIKSAEDVFNVLLRRVLDGSLEAGLRLPNEQAIAAQCGVARSTVRKALDRLREEKLIVSRRGDGHYIAGLSEDEVCSIRFELESNFQDVFEVRRLLDGAAASHAAIKQDLALIQKLEALQRIFRQEVERSQIDLLTIRRTDIEFHEAIFTHSPNALIAQMTGALRAAVGPYWIMWRELPAEHRRMLAESSFNEHELIVTAIKAGDAQVAESAMRHHFRIGSDRFARALGNVNSDVE